MLQWNAEFCSGNGQVNANWTDFPTDSKYKLWEKIEKKNKKNNNPASCRADGGS